MNELIVLVYFLSGQPYWIGPDFILEDHFETLRDCTVFRNTAGWELVRSHLGLNSSPDPVPGIELQCQLRT